MNRVGVRVFVACGGGKKSNDRSYTGTAAARSVEAMMSASRRLAIPSSARRAGSSPWWRTNSS